MAELVPTATEAEWLEARKQGVTASEIAVVMGLSPYSSPYALWHQKLGLLPPQEDNPMMERGRLLEPYVVAKFAEMHPEFIVEGDGRQLYRHAAAPWQLATPDRRLYAPDPDDSLFWLFDGILETKTASSMDDWGEPGTDEIPVHYRAQVLWQCDVMSCARWKVAVLDVPRWQVHVYAGEIDDAAYADIELMRHQALLFLQRMKDGEPPEIDYHPATGSALRAMYAGEDGGDIRVRPSLAISYAAAVKRYKAAERRKDEMTNAVLEVLRDRKRAIDPRTGEPIATRSVSHPKRIDVERLRSEQPAIAAEYTKPPKPEVKLTPAKPKKES